MADSYSNEYMHGYTNWWSQNTSMKEHVADSFHSPSDSLSEQFICIHDLAPNCHCQIFASNLPAQLILPLVSHLDF